MSAFLLRILTLALCAATAGCAGMGAGECRSADWYDLGFRDGIFGLQTQTTLYESQCGTHGAAIDRARYAEGWQHGYWEFHARKGASGHD
jgi:hypothetical protein